MLAPKIEGRLLQALQIEPIDDVLEVGTGSGFLTACSGTSRAARHERRHLSRVRRGGAHQDRGRELAQRRAAHGRRARALELPGAFRRDRRHWVRARARSTTSCGCCARMGRLFVVVGRAPVMEARLITLQRERRLRPPKAFRDRADSSINARAPGAIRPLSEDPSDIMPVVPELTPHRILRALAATTPRRRRRAARRSRARRARRSPRSPARATSRWARFPARLADLDRETHWS